VSATTTPTTMTDVAVNVSHTAKDLLDAAEASPVVKADLETLFDSYSHNPVVAGLASIAGIMLAQEHITVDSTLLTVVIGLVVTGVGYGYQWLSMKMRKPVTQGTTP